MKRTFCDCNKDHEITRDNCLPSCVDVGKSSGTTIRVNVAAIDTFDICLHCFIDGVNKLDRRDKVTYRPTLSDVVCFPSVDLMKELLKRSDRKEFSMTELIEKATKAIHDEEPL